MQDYGLKRSVRLRLWRSFRTELCLPYRVCKPELAQGVDYTCMGWESRGNHVRTVAPSYTALHVVRRSNVVAARCVGRRSVPLSLPDRLVAVRVKCGWCAMPGATEDVH